MNRYLRGLFIFFLLTGSVSVLSSWAVEVKTQTPQDGKLKVLQERLNQLREKQEKIAGTQSQIKDELEILRVWIRHHP